MLRNLVDGLQATNLAVLNISNNQLGGNLDESMTEEEFDCEEKAKTTYQCERVMNIFHSCPFEASLRSQHALEEIDLSHNKLSDESAAYLGQNLKLVSLSMLHLIHNKITDQGEKALAARLVNTNVQAINLSHNAITEQTQQLLKTQYLTINWQF